MNEVRCSTCKGTKRIEFERGQRYVPCVTCSGSGVDWRKTCEAALSREAELDRDNTRLSKEIDDALNREYELREELASHKYKSELYDEVWQKATGMGFANITMALAEIPRLQQRLTAAEQRNSEFRELLDSAFFRLDTFIEAGREMPIPSMEVLRDAILRHCPDFKPAEDTTASVDCGECPNITDGCHGICMKTKPTAQQAIDPCLDRVKEMNP